MTAPGPVDHITLTVERTTQTLAPLNIGMKLLYYALILVALFVLFTTFRRQDVEEVNISNDFSIWVLHSSRPYNTFQSNPYITASPGKSPTTRIVTLVTSIVTELKQSYFSSLGVNVFIADPAVRIRYWNHVTGSNL